MTGTGGFLYIKWPCGCYWLCGDKYWCLTHLPKAKRLSLIDWNLVLDDWTKNRYFDDPRQPVDHARLRVMARARASARCNSRIQRNMIAVEGGTPLPTGGKRFTLYCQYCHEFDVVDARSQDEARRIHRNLTHGPPITLPAAPAEEEG